MISTITNIPLSETYEVEKTCSECGIHYIDVIRRGFMEKSFLRNKICGSCMEDFEEQRRQREAEEQTRREEQEWQRELDGLPPIYRRAVESHVSPSLSAILDWDPQNHPGGIALIGPAGSGKSSAAACLIQRLRRRFVWWSGTEARQVALDATLGKDYKTKEAWEQGFTTGILVIDDLSQAKFTETWSSSLFGLLEHRLSRLMPTLWTSQIGEAELFQKIVQQNGGDDPQANAIARRLFQHSLLIHA